MCCDAEIKLIQLRRRGQTFGTPTKMSGLFGCFEESEAITSDENHLNVVVRDDMLVEIRRFVVVRMQPDQALQSPGESSWQNVPS